MKYLFAAAIAFSLHMLLYNEQAIGATTYVHPALANYNAPARHHKNSRPAHSTPARAKTIAVK